jgi:hypothetical protein
MMVKFVCLVFFKVFKIDTFPQSLNLSKTINFQEWWFTHIIPALKRQRHKDHKFESSLGYMESSRPAWNYTVTLSQQQKSELVS